MAQQDRPIRVLHVDDEPDFTDLTADLLKRADDRFRVETAEGADAAIARLTEAEFDCIVSDYDMPGKNGLEFLEAVREDHPELPFLLFTGKGSEEVASDAISAGVTDYLQKQVGTEQYELLANRISNTVEQYRANRAVEETRRRFRTLIEESNDVTFIVGPDGTFRYASPSAERVLGRTPDELVGTDGFASIHQDDRPMVMEEFATLVEHPEERRTVEFRYELPDGSYTWVEARGRNLLDDPVIGGIVVYARDVTDRKEDELELRRKERRYQAIFNDPNILVALVDVDGTVLDINETALEYVDAGADDLVGSPFWETPWFDHSAEVRDEVRDWIERAATGEYVEFEVDLVRPDGEPYTIQGVFRPVTNEDGEVVSLIISDREITAQKERERELERIRDFFHEAERLGNLGAWEFDADGEVVWTDGTRRIHEVDDSFEPTIEAGIEFFHSDDRAEVERAVDEATEAGEPYDVEARLITAAGNERWVRTRGEPVEGGEGLIRGYIQDVTEQKEREQELDKAKSQLEAAVEAGEVGTWEWHVPADTLVVGPEFARTFGVDPSDARRGVPLERFTRSIHEEDRDRVERRIRAAVETCGDYEAEYRVRDSEDEIRWVVARGHVECDEDGTPRRFPGALVDITERKEAEQALKRQNERLDEFAGVVSHDLRSPLNVAQGRLRLAREECASEHLDAVGRSLGRMEALIDDLLALSRGEDSSHETTTVDVAGLTAACWDDVATKRATLRTEVDRRVRGDRRRLRQLFENLFRNAVEHGGETVTVTVGALDDGFYVEDDGGGIPDDVRESVFDTGYTTSPGGTGFGLSIVRQVVEAHDWEIRVTDSDGGGARFEITGVRFAD